MPSLRKCSPDRVGAEGKASPDTGHPGMAQWTILVLGVLGLNTDYDSIQELANLPAVPLRLASLDDYLKHADRQVDQVRRRVLEGEAIPHAKKVLSIFEPHTEWVSKGKAVVARNVQRLGAVLRGQEANRKAA